MMMMVTMMMMMMMIDDDDDDVGPSLGLNCVHPLLMLFWSLRFGSCLAFARRDI